VFLCSFIILRFVLLVGECYRHTIGALEESASVRNDVVIFVSEGDAVEVDDLRKGVSQRAVEPAPDSWYIARRSLGVIAFWRFVGGSTLANAVSSPLVLGCRLEVPETCTGLGCKFVRNDATRWPAASRTVPKTTGHGCSSPRCRNGRSRRSKVGTAVA
jgi:hypothetical protein